jgi:hypothetical protein
VTEERLTTTDPFKVLLYGRVLRDEDASLAPVFLSVDVLQKYRDASGYSVLRTDTIGRLVQEKSWSIDFGIADREKTIHVTLEDLMHRLPEGEREHWVAHILTPPLSENFVKAKLAPMSCIDDGDLRAF